MRLINKKNFISIVCISFTLIVLVKLIWEKSTGFFDANYTENIFVCLGISVLITVVLALHYYLQQYPFIPVFIGQYLLTVGLISLGIWVLKRFSDVAETAYRDMFISVSIPFFACALVYYVIFFKQIKKANKMLDNL